MASGIDKHKSSDVTVCSICFEKFRTPRILPCTHAFCHGCISSYIVTSCQSKEAPVGFSCPLCREFVPSPAIPGKPENWADRFPVCKMLEKLNKGDDTHLCAACLRENEEEDATEFCITCEESICGTCAKYHKRILTTRNHLVCTLSDPSLAMQLINMSLDTGNCPEHPDKEIELYCNDHLKVCCSLCSNTEHRKCGDVSTIQSRFQRIKEEGSVQKLLQKIRNFEQELVSIKETQEQNITELDSTTDRIMEEAKNIRKSIDECLDKLEKEHLEEIGVLSKNSRNVLNKTIDSLSDRIQFSRQCTKRLEDINDKSNTSFVKKYNEIKESFENLQRQTMNLKINDIRIESNLSRELSQVANLESLSTNKVVHSQREFARRSTKCFDEMGKDTSEISSQESDYSECRFYSINNDKQEDEELALHKKKKKKKIKYQKKKGHLTSLAYIPDQSK